MNIKMIIGVLSLFFVFTNFKHKDSWGPTGHRATGQIAENYLSNKAKRKIKKILNGESLAFVSTYADQIKSDKKYNHFYSWHYVNMPLDGKYATAHKNPKGDLITGIEHCIKVLKDKNASNEDHQLYLKLLVHFIGDLHQPMHIGQKEDKGGNTIQLEWFNKGTNLHKVWDENLIEEWGMSYGELASNEKDLSKEEIKHLSKGNIVDWLEDTHQLTKKIYGSVTKGQNLKYSYSYHYFPIVRTQLQKGGVRLAKLLNDIFK